MKTNSSLREARRAVHSIVPRNQRVAELRDMLKRYDDLSTNLEFLRNCKDLDRLDAGTEVGDRNFSVAVVIFYLKWNVYPIPHFLVTDRIFRATLEHFFHKRGLATDRRISPFTTLRELEESLRAIKAKLPGPKLNLSSLRVGLIHHFLMIHSSFHGFTPGDIALATGSRAKRGNSAWDTDYISERELRQTDRILKELVKSGTDYTKANAVANRRVKKRRWTEPKTAPKIRMAARRALQTLLKLLNQPNI
jgi:hypothetical protein